MFISLKYTLLASSFLLLLVSCNRSITGIRGEGPVTEKTYQLDEGFDRLRVEEAWKVKLIKADQPKVVIRTQENIHPYMEPEVKNGKLVIAFAKGSNFRNIKTQEADVYYTSLKEISASSAGKVEGENLLEQKELNLHASSASSIRLDKLKVGTLNADVSSAATIRLSGTSLEFTGDASSASKIDARSLKVKTANLDASSAANISVEVVDQITADASSGSTIRYSGNPSSTNLSHSSGGSIKSN